MTKIKFKVLACLFLLGNHGIYYQVFSQSINSFSPLKIIGGKSEILTINGQGFGNQQGNSYVSFWSESNQYTSQVESQKFNYLSWTDNQIKLEMPNSFSNKIKLVIGAKELFSNDTLKVQANLGYRQVSPIVYDYLTNNNGEGGITWYIHPVYWNNSEIKQAIADVVQEFRCKTGVNYIVKPMQKWVPLNLNQGIHILAPDSSLAVVGYNEKLWSSCMLGSETFYHNQTQLLRFNTKQDWYYGKGQPPLGKSKFRYVLMHEMGHSLGLGHVNEFGQSMYPSVTLLPSDLWCGRDSISEAEKTTISYYIKLCQDFTFQACNIKPMLPISDCSDVFGNSAQVPTENPSVDFVLYPNPSTSNFWIQFNTALTNTAEFAEITIQSAAGKTISKYDANTASPLFICQNFAPGVYFVRIRCKQTITTQSIIIQP